MSSDSFSDSSSSWILETPPADVQTEIVDRSHELPVVIDFWAPWCQPCRALGPVLEKLATEGGGQFLLVKVNIDEHQELAQAFRVSSIPAVFALKDGQLADQFVGVKDETELKAWLQGLGPSPTQELLRRGQELSESDPLAAEQSFREALSLEPDNDAIRVALAGVLAQQEKDDEARRIIDDLEKRGFLEPEAQQIKSALELRASAEEAGDITELRSAVAEKPDDLKLQLQLAETLAAHKQFEEAMKICLEVIHSDRDGIGQDARESMLKMFDFVGAGSPLVTEYRRKLATALY
ncbi:thioredoxin [Thalassoroseus pseudoceratinae]|uniref:thioredoxin n=1 Tax=Thalassoroseus pseudoceratinae TaxID=2713176 RepID=UPI001420EAF8|nr:thioredoxin [Thalassoroseus pseudoceratinae]